MEETEELLKLKNLMARKRSSNVGAMAVGVYDVDESEMLVHSNPRSGIHYIYDKTNKIAFSYLVDTIDEDWILDDYGIRDWVESLPTKSISLATIANSYKIIGL